MTKKFNKFGYNIADNSTVGATLNNSLEKGDGKSIITKQDFAALLMLFSTEQVIPFSKFGFNVYLKADIDTIPYDRNAPALKKLKSTNDINEYWLQLIDVMLGRTQSTNKTTTSIVVRAYADEQCKEYNSSFLFYMNVRYIKNTKGKLEEVFYVNVNCSPTQLLSGHNAFPIMKFNNIEEKATFLIDMFTLPFYILGAMIDSCVLKSGKSQLTIDSETYNNSIMKLQIADYCKKFASVEERNFHSAILGDVCSSVKVRHNDQGVNIPKALHYTVDTGESKIKNNKHGTPIAKTGFLLKFSSSNYPTFSLGFYNKDLVSESQEAEKTAKGYKKSERKQSSEDKSLAFTSRSIRLDLSIHTQGIIKLSKAFAKTYPGKITKITDKFSSADVRNFMIEVMHIDSTLSIIYKYVLEQELMIEQLMRVTTKQWDRAFDLLKAKGLYDLVDQLKKRQNLVGNEDSFTNLVKKYGGKNIEPKRLRDEIQEATIIYKKDKYGEFEYKKDEHGDYTKEKIVLCKGVDLRFPYLVKLQVNNVIRDSFVDLEKERRLYETNTVPNNYDLKDLHKRAVMAGRKLVRHLSYDDNLEPIPVFVD